MKLACIGPLSPLRTGVAHFSENLLPFLAEHCEIRLFTDANPPSPTAILKRFKTSHISEFASMSSSFDAVLYHMGNHYEYHRSVFEALCRVPGIVLLHDCVLNQFFAKYALERGNFGTFNKLIKLCYPDIGNEEVAAFFRAQADPYRFPMAGVVARLSRGTIVMNEYGRDIVLREAPSARVTMISHPYFPSDYVDGAPEALRKRLNIPEDCFIVSSVGHMTPAKRLDVALEAFRRFNTQFPDSVFLLAGEGSAQVRIEETIRRSELKNVHYLGYLNDAEFGSLLQLADVFINLRYPSNGEMSGALLHMLGHGKVVFVSDYAQFAEFPDGTCIKVSLGTNEIDELAGGILDIARNADHRTMIGETARDYVTRNHTRRAAAESIIRFAEDLLDAKAEPEFPPTGVDDLLRSDNLLKRSYQSLAYNARRLSRHFREQGITSALGHAVKK